MKCIKIEGKSVVYINLNAIESIELDGNDIVINTTNNTKYIEFETKKKAKEIFEKLKPYEVIMELK